MDNFGFFNKNELSHILNNELEFGHGAIRQIEKYCERKRYSIEKIKKKKTEWNQSQNGLILEIRANQIFISKTEEAKKSEVNVNLLVKILIGLILAASVWQIIIIDQYDFEFVKILIGIIFLTAILFGLFKQGKGIEHRSNQLRWIEIAKPDLVFLKENSSILINGEMRSINLFWTEDQEAGSVPNAKLELKINDIRSIFISSGNNYLEVFKCGNEISKLLNKKLNIFQGECLVKMNSEL